MSVYRKFCFRQNSSIWALAGPAGNVLQFQKFFIRAGKTTTSSEKKSSRIMNSPQSEEASCLDSGKGRILRKSAIKLIRSQGRTMGRLNLMLLMTKTFAG